jgi:hypothetical protein
MWILWAASDNAFYICNLQNAPKMRQSDLFWLRGPAFRAQNAGNSLPGKKPEMEFPATASHTEPSAHDDPTPLETNSQLSASS